VLPPLAGWPFVDQDRGRTGLEGTVGDLLEQEPPTAYYAHSHQKNHRREETNHSGLAGATSQPPERFAMAMPATG